MWALSDRHVNVFGQRAVWPQYEWPPPTACCTHYIVYVMPVVSQSPALPALLTILLTALQLFSCVRLKASVPTQLVYLRTSSGSGNIVAGVVPAMHADWNMANHHDQSSPARWTQCRHSLCANTSTYFCPTSSGWSTRRWVKVGYLFHRSMQLLRRFWKKRGWTHLAWITFAQYPTCHLFQRWLNRLSVAPVPGGKRPTSTFPVSVGLPQVPFHGIRYAARLVRHSGGAAWTTRPLSSFRLRRPFHAARTSTVCFRFDRLSP